MAPEEFVMTITTVGIDLAKNVFAVHGVDQNGKTVLIKPKVSRAALPELIASLPPCVIGMEACSGAHYWARLYPSRIFDASNFCNSNHNSKHCSIPDAPATAIIQCRTSRCAIKN